MAHNADPNSYDMHASISGSRLVIYPYTQATDCWLFQNPYPADFTVEVNGSLSDSTLES